MVTGLRTYFDFTLSTLLLYNFERGQYDRLFPPEPEPGTSKPKVCPGKKRLRPEALLEVSVEVERQNTPTVQASPRAKKGRRSVARTSNINPLQMASSVAGTNLPSAVDTKKSYPSADKNEKDIKLTEKKQEENKQTAGKCYF